MDKGFEIKFKCDECRDIFMSTPLHVFKSLVDYLEKKHYNSACDAKLDDYVDEDLP